ncbi:PiggyBac transposable element-derived protein 4 [Plakobranchus ocellatus]|uniref:PiggyBac transposable element-derived protein 4 n=1 Tax=Plakobranchus ocellatus TaxID=259542 RepID=A0AAV4CKW7_9GAST|nr:PiggyBac transposable element-derived protein 4 [Plakobranchus ocellatus]
MEPGGSGERPPTRVSSLAVRQMIQKLWDENDSDCILSDDEGSDYSNSRSSSESGSSSENESVFEESSARSKSKGALPSQHGKKFPRKGRACATVQNNTRPRSRSRSPLDGVDQDEHNQNLDLDLDEEHVNTALEADHVSSGWAEIEEGATENAFRFVRINNTGVSPDVGLNEQSSALECLFAILTGEIITFIIDSINTYAVALCQRNRPARRYSVFLDFQPVTRNEFLRFLAMLLAMGLNPRRSVRSFWSNKPHEHTPWFARTMPRKRFEALYHTFLHAAGANAEEQEKIEPFLNKLTQAFQAAFYPSKELSIDEMVIGFHGRWKYKQFNASKPSKYHIKTFGLCDSKTGYVVNLFTYYGANTGYHPDLDPKAAQAIKVFEKLLRPLEKGHHIYADRFYTSMPLLRYLADKGFHYTGTVDVRRKDFPPEIKTLKLDYLQMKWYMMEGNWLLLSAFRDKKAKKNVVAVTTEGEVSTTAKQRRREVIHKPSCIDHYNQCMNGCDRADQQIQYYGLQKRKSYKWWKKIFHFLIEITIVNSSIIFNHLQSAQQNQKKIPLACYKDLLIQQLMDATAEDTQRTREVPLPVAVAQRLAPETHFQETMQVDRNCRVCSTPQKRKRTRTVCSVCPGKPYLCKKDCFRIWHTRQNLRI